MRSSSPALPAAAALLGWISLGVLASLFCLPSVQSTAFHVRSATHVNLAQYRNVLVSIAHPDDAETICGGLLAQLVAQGSQIRYVVGTSGQKGWHKDNSTSSLEVGVIREQEQINAAAVLGIHSVEFLRWMDGEVIAVDPIMALRPIVFHIRQWRPDLILTFHPDSDWSAYQYGLIHRDHMTMGMRTLDATYPTARDFTGFPDQVQLGLQPWIAPEVWLFSFTNPEIVVDISQQMPVKLKALLEHKSQYENPADVAAALVAIAEKVANSSSKASAVKLAEGYTPVKML